ATGFRRPRSPLTIRIARRGTRSDEARKSMRASFAAPSTGGAATRTTSAPPRSPAASVFFARGTTRIVISTLSNHLARRGGVGAGLELDLLDEARPVHQDPLLALARFLLADELERVAQRLDARLDRRLDVLALELEAVDLALDVLEPRLRFLEQQLRSALGLAHDALRVGVGRGHDPAAFGVGISLDIVRQLLRRHHRRLQVALVLAVLVEHRLHAHEVLA